MDNILYSQLQSVQLAKEENTRQQHFAKMQDFQDRNEAKYQALTKYQEDKNIGDLAKQDE